MGKGLHHSPTRWPMVALTVILLQPLIFYRRHLFFLTAHIPFDIQEFHLPLASFIARSVKEHVWPFWNPLEYGGAPIHADIQAQLFYPGTWMVILMDSLTGGGRLFYWLEWLVPIHMMIAGIGSYFLFRKLRCSASAALFGATVFQIGPFFVSQAEHLTSICTAAWFPVILLCLSHLAEDFNTRWFAGLSIGVAMSVLSGFPATAFVVLALSGFFCVALILTGLAKPGLLALFAAGCLLGAGIAAIQLIPSFELSSLSVASLRYRWKGNGGGLHWESLASLLWPNYYHIFSPWDRAQYKLPYEFTFMFTFCGHAALVLIAMASLFLRKSRLLAVSVALLILSAVWMLGENTPIYPAILTRLPHFLQGMLYAESALLGFSMFAAASAALVLALLEPKLPSALLVILLAANSWNLIRIGANKPFNAFDGSYEVATAHWVDNGRPMPDALRTLTQANAPPLRIDFLSGALGLLQTGPGLFQLSSADGDNPFLLLRYYGLRRTFSDDVEWSRRQYLRNLDTPWIRALNVGYVLENANAPARLVHDEYELLPLGSVRIYKVKDPLPRFYLQTRIRSVTNEQQALSQVKNPAFDPAHEAVVEGVEPNWKPDEPAVGSVKVVSYENNRVVLDVQTSGRALLATSEALYPGWTATVNGRPAPILPTNVAFRGISLEPGENHIVLRYFPDRLILSLAISLSALGLTVILFSDRKWRFMPGAIHRV